jgi:hypothetical protein
MDRREYWLAADLRLTVVDKENILHVFLVIVGGAVLLGVFLLFGGLWGTGVTGMLTGAKAFAPVWAVVAAVNMWIGVSHAGYSVREELPILLLVFLVPIALSGGIVWCISRI